MTLAKFQIVHRIVRITKNKSGQLQFNTQGDANTVRDPWTLTIQGDYIYRVRWSVPLLGYVANSYQNHRGYYLLGAGIVLILIALVTILETRQGRRRRHARRAVPAPAVMGQDGPSGRLSRRPRGLHRQASPGVDRPG
jgi:hypothetical protein